MIDIELAFVTPESEILRALQLDAGATVADAIAAAELNASYPEYDFDQMATGIWGRRVERNRVLKSGDRVEIYRELERDPMEARRLRASD